MYTTRHYGFTRLRLSARINNPYREDSLFTYVDFSINRKFIDNLPFSFFPYLVWYVFLILGSTYIYVWIYRTCTVKTTVHVLYIQISCKFYLNQIDNHFESGSIGLYIIEPTVRANWIGLIDTRTIVKQSQKSSNSRNISSKMSKETAHKIHQTMPTHAAWNCQKFIFARLFSLTCVFLS